MWPKRPKLSHAPKLSTANADQKAQSALADWLGIMGLTSLPHLVLFVEPCPRYDKLVGVRENNPVRYGFEALVAVLLLSLVIDSTNRPSFICHIPAIWYCVFVRPGWINSRPVRETAIWCDAVCASPYFSCHDQTPANF